MSVPVTIRRVHHGLSSASGQVYLTDDYLVIELQVTVLGMIRRKPLVVKVAPEAVNSIRLRRGILRDRLVIRPWRSSLLAAIPGEHEGEVSLRVRRVHREEAEILVEEVGYWLDQKSTDVA